MANGRPGQHTVPRLTPITRREECRTCSARADGRCNGAQPAATLQRGRTTRGFFWADLFVARPPTRRPEGWRPQPSDLVFIWFHIGLQEIRKGGDKEKGRDATHTHFGQTLLSRVLIGSAPNGSGQSGGGSFVSSGGLWSRDQRGLIGVNPGRKDRYCFSTVLVTLLGRCVGVASVRPASSPLPRRLSPRILCSPRPDLNRFSPCTKIVEVKNLVKGFSSSAARMNESCPWGPNKVCVSGLRSWDPDSGEHMEHDVR